jgi:hypothetical protein
MPTAGLAAGVAARNHRTRRRAWFAKNGAPAEAKNTGGTSDSGAIEGQESLDELVGVNWKESRLISGAGDPQHRQSPCGFLLRAFAAFRRNRAVAMLQVFAPYNLIANPVAGPETKVPVRQHSHMEHRLPAADGLR